MAIVREDKDGPESLDIASDTLAYVALKARSFDAQAGVSGLGEGSNPTDDQDVSVLEGGRDDPTARELRAAIARLTEDEQVALVALVWIGRGDFEAEDWEDAKSLARERRTGPTARYLLGMPLLGDYLEQGADALGLDLFEAESKI